MLEGDGDKGHIELYLDESGTCPLHRMNQKAIPPERTRPLAIPSLLPSADPDQGDCGQHRHKYNDQMEEAERGGNGLENVTIKAKTDSLPQSVQAVYVIRQFLCDFRP